MASIERTAYPRFRHEPNARELQDLFTPAQEEIQFARALVRSSDEHFLAAVLLLKCLQYFGCFPELSEIPNAIVNHVRICLRLPQDAKPAYDQTRTMRRHQTAIRDHLQLKPRHSREARKIAVRTVFDAAQVIVNPADLINVAVEHLRADQCELPSFSTLDRMVNRIRTVVHRHVFSQAMRKLSPEDVARLDGLLKTTEVVQRHTSFQEIKEAPKKPSLTHLDAVLGHLTWLESLGDVDSPLSGIPPALLQHFATEAKALHAGELREVQAPKRYMLLLCLIHRMRVRTRDDAAEMFVKRMDKIHRQARERLLEIQARQREKTENLVAALAGVIGAVRSDDSSDSKVQRIDQVFAERGGIERLQEDCEAVRAWSNNNYLPLLGRPYKRYRYLLFRLIGALQFVSTTQERALLDALAIVRANQNRRAEWIPTEDVDFSFVGERRWNDVVLRVRNGKREMHRRQFEICVFTHLALELRTCDMAVPGSEQYADYREQLLPWAECEPLVESYCKKLGLPGTADEFVQQLRTELESTAAEVDAGFPSNTAVSINKDGAPVLKRPAANKPPASATELEAALHTFLPERSLLDMVWLTNAATRFTRHFGPISGLDAKLDQLAEKYCAAVFAMGSGMGVTQGARHMHGLVTAPTLALINRRHVTTDKLDAAHQDILDAYNQFELPRCWGSGKTAAFDGSLFELSEQNLLADLHFRYRLKGVVAFQVVSDLYIALFTHFIPPGVWEAIYIIEALMKNRSNIQPDTVFADTQGQSTPVFAFTYLLGIKLMPRIRNWKDLSFFRPSKNVHYTHIDGLFKDPVAWEMIRTHWRDLMQVALSIYTGRISSPILLRKLSHYSRKNRLYQAAQELGRVQRTIYLLRWISDMSLRSGVTAGTNSVEGYHALTKWLQFGVEGVIQENDPDEQQKRVRYLGLLASALIYWNVVEISRALGELGSQGYPVNKADLAYLSPYITRHIKRFGDYTIHTDLAPGPIHHELSLTRKSPGRAVQQALPFAVEA